MFCVGDKCVILGCDKCVILGDDKCGTLITEYNILLTEYKTRITYYNTRILYKIKEYYIKYYNICKY